MIYNPFMQKIWEIPEFLTCHDSFNFTGPKDPQDVVSLHTVKV